MARTLRSADFYTLPDVETSMDKLREALTYAKLANCPQLAAAIRRALKSADGARRHAQRRRNTEQEGRAP